MQPREDHNSLILLQLQIEKIESAHDCDTDKKS